MNVPNLQTEVVERIQALVSANTELLTIIADQQANIDALSNQVEKLESKPVLQTGGWGIRPKDRVQHGEPNYHEDSLIFA